MLKIGFRLFSSSILRKTNGIVIFDLYFIKFILSLYKHYDIILIVYSYVILRFSDNCHSLLIDRNNLDNILTILLAIQKDKNIATIAPIAHY